MEQFLESLPSFAADIKLNSKALMESKILSKKQVSLIFLACTFGSKNKALFDVFQSYYSDLNQAEVEGAQIASTIMSMTNVYYRFTHLVSNKEYEKLPAGLRMNKMAPMSHGLDPIDFELCSIAVSALNGCGMCIDSHERKLKKENVESVWIQEAVKIAAVVNSLSLFI